MVNYLHEILVEIPTVCTLSVTSVIVPISALSIPFVLGDPNVALHIMRCVHGSNYEILSEWDPMLSRGYGVDQATPLYQAFLLI